MESVNENDVRALVLHDPDEEWELRGDFTSAACAQADALRAAALGSARGSEFGCGHGSTYQLSTDLPVPQCLSRALSGAQLEAPEGPWPEFGRTEHPTIDWPALIEAHPAELTWNYAMLECNRGANPAAISTAYRLLADRGCRPWFDVCLWVDPDARIAVEPVAIFVEPAGLDPCLADQVDEILVAGGRPREALRYDEGPGYWQLNA